MVLKRRLVLALAFGALAGASSFGAGGAGARTLATCTPTALTPYDNPPIGWYARANVSCGASLHYTGEIRLTRSDGTILDHNSIDWTGSSSFATYPPDASCTGNVHSFIWINVGGVVKSSTSSNVAC